jgi:hypothetical protein
MVTVRMIPRFAYVVLLGQVEPWSSSGQFFPPGIRVPTHVPSQ